MVFCQGRPRGEQLCQALAADYNRGLGQGALAEEEDPRVDVALYFIAPHRLRPVDIDFITRLSEIVPVVRQACGAHVSRTSPVCCWWLITATLDSRPSVPRAMLELVPLLCPGLLFTQCIQADPSWRPWEAC